MITVMQQGNTVEYNVLSLIADSASDIAKVAEEYDYASPGSTIFDISTSNVYMLNSEGEWKQI